MQDHSSHGKLNGGAKYHRGHAAEFRRQIERRHAPEAITAASTGLVRVWLLPIRVPGVAVRMRRRLLGGRQPEPSMRVAADKGERQQHRQTPDQD